MKSCKPKKGNYIHHFSKKYVWEAERRLCHVMIKVLTDTNDIEIIDDLKFWTSKISNDHPLLFKTFVWPTSNFNIIASDFKRFLQR